MATCGQDILGQIVQPSGWLRGASELARGTAILTILATLCFCIGRAIVGREAPSLPPQLARSVAEAGDRIRAALPEPRRPFAGLLVLDLADDPDGIISAELRRSLSRGGEYRLVEQDLFHCVLDEVASTFGLRRTGWDAANAVCRAKISRADIVLVGAVEHSVTRQGQSHIAVRVQAIRTCDNERLLHMSFTLSTGA